MTTKNTPIAKDAYSGTEGQYLLPHNTTEIARLTRQHELYRSTAAGKLLAVPVEDKTSLRILDAGCANGKWLSDLPLQFPEKQLSLHGIDIGSDLFSARPTNVTTDLRKHNLLHPIPESWGWDESFDVVHQRLLVWAFKKSEWSTVVGNLLKLLKPGGYIQLVEVEWDDKSTDRSPMFQKHTTLYTYRGIQAGMDTDIAYRLEDLLRDAGCKDVTKVQFDHGFGKMAREKEFVESSAQLLIQGFRPLGDGGIPGVAKDTEEFHAFLDDLEVYIREHGYMTKLNFVYGRKP